MDHAVYRIPVKIAYIGGGSLNWAPKLMSDLAYDTRLDPEIRLYDIDFTAAERNAALGQRFAEASRGVPARYRAYKTLGDALQGADIVVVSILPGRFADMAEDIGIPARIGIPQAVGDTVGPGGFVRAMRAIPMLADIGKAIATYAPRAFVCNLTNPMSVLTGALFAAFPNIRAWGECHEVTKIRRQVAWIANQKADDPIWTHRDVEVNVLGINHFTFVDKITLDGQDMMPAYLAFLNAHRNTGWTQVEPGQGEAHARYFGSKNLVAFDLHRRFGIPAAAGDRHLAEFFPVADYLDDPQRWGFALTPVAYRVQDRADKLQKVLDLAEGRIMAQPEKSDEALVDQIIALMGGGKHVSNVNLPNCGQLDGFPEGTIVETNAQFSDQGVTPLAAGRLPAALESIVLDHASRQTELLKAVLDQEGEALFPLFRSDPLVRGLPEEAAWQMFKDMIAATSAWLPEHLAEGAA